jgi:hypothetical protein
MLMKSPSSDIRKFAARLLRDYANEFADDPHGFKKYVLRTVRLYLPPGRGRPRDTRFDAALAMLKQRNSIKEILRRQIPDFDQLDTYTRYLAEKGLRQAIARRRRLSSSRTASMDGSHAEI